MSEYQGYNIIPLPAFESGSHRSGLDRGTRLRLLAAVRLYVPGDKIILGGDRLRAMPDTFANLMENFLVLRKIPSDAIKKEITTVDTASQMEWVSQNTESKSTNVIITDRWQCLHVLALQRGFNFHSKVLAVEDLLPIPNRVSCFYICRELALTFLTLAFDPRGDALRLITQKRRR